MITLLQNIRILCNLFAYMLGALLAVLVVHHDAPSLQFVWAMSLLIFLAISAGATVLAWFLGRDGEVSKP